MLKTECAHFRDQVASAAASHAEVCEICGTPGPLRMCGFVGCCESKNSHDTAHWKEMGHAIILQVPLSESSFTYCYEHSDYLRE